MPDFIMMVGLPYSGKSYVAQSLGLSHGRTVISSDAEVMAIADSLGKHYNEVFAEYANLAQSRAANALIQAVRNSESILVDQTNLTIASRARKLIQVPSTYRRVCISVPQPCAEELAQRKAARTSHVVPEAALDYMLSIYTEPTLSEGFDIVYTAGFDDIVLTK